MADQKIKKETAEKQVKAGKEPKDSKKNQRNPKKNRMHLRKRKLKLRAGLVIIIKQRLFLL